jgi:putative endonuclease
MNQKKELGRWGEELAETFLVQKGFKIVGKNVRTRYGEIDLIARDGKTTVFVEVKTRSSDAFGLPETGITFQKKTHMLNTARAYMQTHSEWEGEWRMDVIAIMKQPANTPPEIVHFENVLL